MDVKLKMTMKTFIPIDEFNKDDHITEGLSKPAIKKQIKIIDKMIDDETGGNDEPLTDETLQALETERERLEKLLKESLDESSRDGDFKAAIKAAWNDGLHTGRTTRQSSDVEIKWNEFKRRIGIRESEELREDATPSNTPGMGSTMMPSTQTGAQGSGDKIHDLAAGATSNETNEVATFSKLSEFVNNLKSLDEAKYPKGDDHKVEAIEDSILSGLADWLGMKKSAVFNKIIRMNPIPARDLANLAKHLKPVLDGMNESVNEAKKTNKIDVGSKYISSKHFMGYGTELWNGTKVEITKISKGGTVQFRIYHKKRANQDAKISYGHEAKLADFEKYMVLESVNEARMPNMLYRNEIRRYFSSHIYGELSSMLDKNNPEPQEVEGNNKWYSVEKVYDRNGDARLKFKVIKKK